MKIEKVKSFQPEFSVQAGHLQRIGGLVAPVQVLPDPVDRDAVRIANRVLVQRLHPITPAHVTETHAPNLASAVGDVTPEHERVASVALPVPVEVDGDGVVEVADERARGGAVRGHLAHVEAVGDDEFGLGRVKRHATRFLVRRELPVRRAAAVEATVGVEAELRAGEDARALVDVMATRRIVWREFVTRKTRAGVANGKVCTDL